MQTLSKMPPASSAGLSPDNYTFLQQYLYRESGIVIDCGKSYLLESRLLPIIKAENLSTINDLCRLLRATAPPALKTKVIESLTTNETLFFRDSNVFDALEKSVLPQLIEAKNDIKRINIWSAAASTGQEAYSLAILLAERGLTGWSIQVLGTDLNQQVLDRAAQGRYLQIEVNRGLPAKYLVKHFTRVGLDWQLSPTIRSMVKFRQLDLRASMRGMAPFDLVFCRNVLIYFDVDTKKKILAEIRSTMRSGSLLVLGAAETTLNLDDNYVRVPHGAAAFYRLP
ncbi:MAG: protein-glutamate O-methyltransferase CheR [Acidobacteria bacterium]|nr:protein-glutamate O-methyltransferase CheR [Acidobacteriota bacterium]